MTIPFQGELNVLFQICYAFYEQKKNVSLHRARNGMGIRLVNERNNGIHPSYTTGKRIAKKIITKHILSFFI